MPSLSDEWELISPSKLAEKMQEHGYTYRALALEAGVGKSAINDLHRGTRAVCSRRFAGRVAKALNVQVEDLFRPVNHVEGATR